MRISPEVVARLQEILAARVGQVSPSTPSADSSTSSDAEAAPVSLSAELRLILLLHQMVKQMSEVDMERVRQVQEQILQGTYNPVARAVAEAMLQELGG